MRRFYAPKNQFTDKAVTLDSDETKHLRNVLRMAKGDKLQVFDGIGNEFLCEISEITKKQTSLEIIKQILPKSPESDLDLSLAVAILKGDKFDLVIQKAVELGVTKFIPIITKRCDVRLKHVEKKIIRWQKIIIEASKQCGRAKVMEIAKPIEFKEFIKTTKSTSILFSERNGESFENITPSKNITAIIGSEGGWEDSELELAKQNKVQIITLGGRVLRAETAAIAISTIMQNHFGDFT